MTKRESQSTIQKPVPGQPSPPATVVPVENEFIRIKILHDLAKAMKNTRRLNTKLQLATEKARKLTDSDICLFCSVDQTGGNHVVNTVFGDPDLNEKLLGMTVPASVDLPPDTDTNKCFLIRFDAQYSRTSLFADRMCQLGFKYGMVAPLQIKDRHFGFLFSGNRKPVDFTKTGQYLLSLVGNLLAAEIDRKRTEKEHDHLETVLEQAAETIVITDRDGVIQYVNPSFELVSGYKRHEVLGKRPSLLHSGQQDSEFYENMWKTLRAGRIWRGQIVNRAKDGNLYDLDATISPIKNDRGEITDYVSVRKDVTQEILLRRQLYQAQKMEAIGTLAGGIAHDFNNLMMGIQGNISLMRMEMPEDSDHQQRCKTIETIVQKGASLTRQLLGVAKGGKYQQIPTDISKLVTDSLEMFGRTKKEINTHMAQAPLPCIAEVDPGQIDQVLLNLFVNAWQAMPEGGDLYVETEQVTINGKNPGNANLSPGPHVKITVRDTGIGIDGVTIEKIFDPFFTTKDKSRGTGLGLASAYGIIKNHGGIIQVRSNVNEGTSFEIFLPACQKSSVSITTDADDITKGRETVLLVDDEAAILEICGEMLKRLGYNAITAISGEEAIALFETGKNDIDLVILDLIMPGINGEELYDSLVALKPEVKVLLSSGYAIETQAKQLLARGAVGFIQKPFSVSGLSRKVRQVLSDS
jgi:PAS domain S-box-containing protein